MTRQGVYPLETAIKKVKSEVDSLQLYYKKDGQKIAEIGCDLSIVFFTEPEFYIYPEQVRQVLAIAENFRTIFDSL